MVETVYNIINLIFSWFSLVSTCITIVELIIDLTTGEFLLVLREISKILAASLTNSIFR